MIAPWVCVNIILHMFKNESYLFRNAFFSWKFFFQCLNQGFAFRYLGYLARLLLSFKNPFRQTIMNVVATAEKDSQFYLFCYLKHVIRVCSFFASLWSFVSLVRREMQIVKSMSQIWVQNIAAWNDHSSCCKVQRRLNIHFKDREQWEHPGCARRT